MKNLDLVDKLVYITNLAKDKLIGMGQDTETIDEYEEELIEELQKDDTIYILKYGENKYRMNTYGDEFYLSSLENLSIKLLELFKEDNVIDGNGFIPEVGQYEFHTDKGESIYFSIDILDVD